MADEEINGQEQTLILASSILTPIFLKLFYKGVKEELPKLLPEIDPDD